MKPNHEVARCVVHAARTYSDVPATTHLTMSTMVVVLKALDLGGMIQHLEEEFRCGLPDDMVAACTTLGELTELAYRRQQ